MELNFLETGNIMAARIIYFLENHLPSYSHKNTVISDAKISASHSFYYHEVKKPSYAGKRNGEKESCLATRVACIRGKTGLRDQC